MPPILGPLPDPLTLYLVRHGETEWSLSGRHTGRTDIALTTHGEDQARTLVPALAAIQFAHVFTSPLQRARQTCDLAGLGASAEIVTDLAEWDYGQYEGRRSIDIRKTRQDGRFTAMAVPAARTRRRCPNAPTGSLQDCKS